MTKTFISNRKTTALIITLLLMISLLLQGAAFATAGASTTNTPITIDPLFQKALVKIEAAQGTAEVQKITAQVDQFLSAIQAADTVKDKVTSHQKKVDLRGFKITTIISALGQGIVSDVIQAVDAAVTAANAKVLAAQAKGINVTQSKQLIIQATSSLASAKGTADFAASLEFALLAGNSVQLIGTLLDPFLTVTTPTPGTTPPPVVTPPASPPAANLWTTIETPRAWDYVPTSPSQSACGSTGTTYEVGSGLAYTKLSQVPWLKLLPCDTVNIHWQPTPYKEITLLSNRGAANKYIKITGIPGPNGELPVIDGDGAVTAAGIPFRNTVFERLGLFVISAPIGYTWGYKPGYIEISNLEIRNANLTNNLTNGAGKTSAWDEFASGIYIEYAENIAIRNCDIHDNGNGLFQNSKYDEQGQSRYLLVEGNYFHNNGVAGSAREHNAYTEGVGTVYQYNRFGDTRPGSYGDNIKERSAGVTFRYNSIEGGVHLIDLLDPQSNSSFERIQKDAWGNLLVNSAYIYGNTMIMRTGPNVTGWQHTLVGFGDGVNAWGNIRSGKIYFYNNTVISQYDYEFWHQPSLTLFSISNNFGMPTVQATNNIFHAMAVTPGAKPEPLAIFYHYGNADFSNNWMSAGWLNIDPHVHAPGMPLTVDPSWNGSGVKNIVSNPQNDPGFVDAAHDNFKLTANSPLVNAGASLDPEIMKTGNVPNFEYLYPQSSKLRKQDASLDPGAFEY